MTLIAIVLVLGLTPFLIGIGGRGRRGAAVAIVAVALLLTVAVGWAASRRPAETGIPTAGRPVEQPAETFAGSGECQACHPGEYASWHASYHRTMTQLATPDVVRGAFAGVALETPDGDYRLEERDGTFYVNGQRVVMTTGSNTMQVYWVSDEVGRSVSLMQAVYLLDEQRWIPRRDAFLQPPKGPVRTDKWNEKCIICHSTDGRPRLADNVDTHVGEFGIACEACHGPAERHADKHRMPTVRYASYWSGDDADTTIANPSRMTARQSSHVCARCHASTVFAPGGHEQAFYNGNGDSFRPGDDLNETGYVIKGPNDPLGPPDPFDRDAMMWPDGPARGSGREFGAMMHSACYGTGEREDNVSCLSCHRMHQEADDPRPVEEWATDQLGRGMDGDVACLQCHEKYAADLEAHTRHPAESSGSRCYNCHMPHTTYGLLKAIRSHYISSPDVTNDLETGRPNACNLCHLDRSLGWSAAWLNEWYEQRPPRMTVDQRDQPASALWLLSGEARQRVLAAWHVGWGPAQETSGTEWIPPVLAPLLADPYSAVRVVSGRSLRSLPGYENFEYDDFGGTPELQQAAERAWNRWWGRQRQGDGLGDPEAPRLDPRTINRLLARRDDTAVGVTE